jgi:hypothetical protein
MFYIELNAQVKATGPHQNMYIVVRSLVDFAGDRIDYEIKVNDIIKLGRVKYAVIEIGRTQQSA